MFLDDFIQRKIASQLQPWLSQEPEWETKIGFLRFHIVARNLRFDTLALNRLIDGPLSFSTAVVEEVDIRIAPWSAPAFNVEVRGVDVTMTTRKREASRGSGTSEASSNASLQLKKKVLAKFDPEGSVLHEKLEKLMSYVTTKNWRKISAINLGLAHLCLLIDGFRLRIEDSLSDERHQLLWEITELNAECPHIEHGCLLRGFVSSIFRPLRDGYFKINAKGLDIGMERRGRVSSIVSFVEPCISIRTKDCLFLDTMICASEMRALLTPTEIKVMVAVSTVLVTEPEHHKTGKQLWEIARDSMGYCILSSKYSLSKVFVIAVLFLRLVKSYQLFLQLVTCLAGKSVGRTVSEMPRAVILSKSIEQWKMISEIEKELPPEVISRARRVARHRVVSKVEFNEASFESRNTVSGSYFWKFLILFAVIWREICSLFDIILGFFYPKKCTAAVLDDFGLQHSFSLNLGKMSLVVSPVDAVQDSDHLRRNLKKGGSYSDLLAFCLQTEGVVLVYEEDIFRDNLSFLLGSFRVTLSSLTERQWEETVDNFRTVIWMDPAILFSPSEENESGSPCNLGTTFGSLSRKINMWPVWKKMNSIFPASNIFNVGHPCVMCWMENFRLHDATESADAGFWKCGLMVGKLYFSLTYSVLFSMAVLVKQMQHAFHHLRNFESAPAVPRSQRTYVDSSGMSWQGQLKLMSEALKLAMMKWVPCKPIEFAALIAGLHTDILLKREKSFGSSAEINLIAGRDGFDLTFDIRKTEISICPAPVSGDPRSNYNNAESFRFEEAKLFGQYESNGNFVSQGQIPLAYYFRIDGVNAYFEDSEQQQHQQILILKAFTCDLSTIRDYHLSFGSNSVALSVALSGVLAGSLVSLHVDELSVMLQVVESLYNVVPIYGFGDSASNISIGSHPSLKQGKTRPSIEPDEITLHNWDAAVLNYENTSFLLTGTFDLDPSNMILRYTRKVDERASSSMDFDAYNIKNPTLLDLPDTGLWLSLQKTHLDISLGKEKVDIHSECSQFKAAIFRYRNQIGIRTIQLEIDGAVPQSLDCLYEVCLSGCSFGLFVGSPENSCSLEGSSGVNSVASSDSVDSLAIDSLSTHGNERPSGGSPQASSQQLLSNLNFDAIYIGSSSAKCILLSAHTPKKLISSLTLGRDFQKIRVMIQDGFVIVEAAVLAAFSRCLTSYLHSLLALFAVGSLEKQMKIAISGESMSMSSAHMKPALKISDAESNSSLKLELLEALTLKISQLSLIIVASNDSGKIEEIIVTADLSLNFKLEDGKKKFIFDLSLLQIRSQIIDRILELKAKEDQIAHFSSNASSVSSPYSIRQDSSAAVPSTKSVLSVPHDASSGSSPASAIDSSTTDSELPIVHASHQNYILDKLTAFVSAETADEDDSNAHPVECWFGNGSVMGFDLTISLSEMIMVMDATESLFEAFEKEASVSMKDRLWSSPNQELQNDSEADIPDGAVVAIQDVHQQMYITVDYLENKFCLSGTVHYSLVGERALFRVKWQQRRWNFQDDCFSLLSLYARSDSGEPLRLNYCKGSGFVDISSTDDARGALWKKVSRKVDNYDDDANLQPYSYDSRKTFYLLNKKNGCGIAFIDKVPEFVQKPGNLFKFKRVHVPSLARSSELQSTNFVETDRSKSSPGQKPYCRGVLPSINLRIDKVTLTIVHELPDHKDKFLLLQVCISDTEVDAQVMSRKTRIMSKMTTALYYFSAHKNLWKELVRPFEICVFYRSRFRPKDIVGKDPGAPARLHLRVKEVNVPLTELGLDILLFVIGKLDLAGPFSVKNSSIFANCWKVENQSSAHVVCTIYDNQAARVRSRECSFFYLRRLMDQPSEAQHVLIKLDTLGTFSTSSIRLRLSETQTFAWRTRIMSSQDSRTYPGPCVVFDISKNLEEGLSISVSPLLRIQNLTELSMELRFQRPQQNKADSASILLKKGETVDDCMAAFDAINSSAGSKKALLSLNVGNFIFSFRPEIDGLFSDTQNSYSVEWSENLNGGKAVRLLGVIDKLSYRMRKAFYVESNKCSFSTASCFVKSGDTYVTRMYFLVQSIARDVPVMKPTADSESSNSPIALQEQKEIFLLPTIKVSNFLQSDIHVLITETGTSGTEASDKFGSQATVRCGSTVELYANPAIMYFTITLVAFNSSCKPVNSGDWVKKLSKQKDDIQFLDIVLEFHDGKYSASLRLTRSDQGILEAMIFTHYTLKNGSDFPLFSFASNQKPLPRDKAEKLGNNMPPDLGCVLPPKSVQSWFMKSNKLCLKLLDEEASQILLDLDALSGLAELSLVKDRDLQTKQLFKLGVSLRPLTSKLAVPSQVVSFAPRYIASNESDQQIFVRQCFLENDSEGIIPITRKERRALVLWVGKENSSQISIFDKLLMKHRIVDGDPSIFVQFKPKEPDLGWSGPVCVASLGRFFLKFRRSSVSSVYQSKPARKADRSALEFATVHVVEEGSSLVMQFRRPPNIDLPYRIENHLPDESIIYYQKDTSEMEALEPGGSLNYVWDDFTCPHKLVVKINGLYQLREINLDKLRPWKPFYRVRLQRELSYNLPLDIASNKKVRRNHGHSNGLDMEKVGYEVYADGPTRVLRICSSHGSVGGDMNDHSRMTIQLRVSTFAIQLLKHSKQDSSQNEDATEEPTYTPIVSGRMQNISLYSIFFEQQKFIQLRAQSITVDCKWVGAPFAAMLRRHQISDDTEDILLVVFVLNSTISSVRHVKYSSILLQPIDLNIDEETLMKIVPFWRTSLSQSTKSQKYYFDHFEIQPVKIFANFLPVSSYLSYGTTEETLVSLLHTVIKIPAIKNRVVELNGISVSHALVTTRELLLKCAQHYSWYAMRAIYIAKGSTLLPPSFASVFDDLSSSSLDAFFDPSSRALNVQGLTLGTFKLLSKYVGGKGLSGTKRYFGDLGKTLKAAGSNVLFVAATEVSDSVLKGAENSGFDGMVAGFHQGILKLAMEPSLLGTAIMEGGPDRKIKLDHSPGIDELYIEGYLQAMLDTVYKQEYLRVRVVDNQVILKNLPPNSTLINEIMARVKDFLISKGLLKGHSSATSPSIRNLRADNDWKIVPTVRTLCEHLFVSFAISILRRQAGKAMGKLKLKEKWDSRREEGDASSSTPDEPREEQKGLFVWRWGIGKFVLSGIVAYMDGRLCRSIPHPVARRIVSGFLLSYLDKKDSG